MNVPYNQFLRLVELAITVRTAGMVQELIEQLNEENSTAGADALNKMGERLITKAYEMSNDLETSTEVQYPQ